jgi:hypothetical protein
MQSNGKYLPLICRYAKENGIKHHTVLIALLSLLEGHKYSFDCIGDLRSRK